MNNLSIALLLAIALFNRGEYVNGVHGNMQIAAWRVNSYFETHVIDEHHPFSYLQAVGDFRGYGDWIVYGGITGAGACEMATLLKRAAITFNEQLGAWDADEREYVGEWFTLTYAPHGGRNPAKDLIKIWWDVPGSPNRFDFGLRMNEEGVPKSVRLAYRINEDAQGNFTATLEAR